MIRKLTKLFAVLLSTVLLLFAMPFSAFAFNVDPQFCVDGKSASTLADAFEKANDTGSVITQEGKTSDYQTIKSGIEVKKNVTLFLGKEDFNSNVNRISYTGENSPLFTIIDGGVLTIRYSTIYGNSNAVNTYGGLIRVEKGGTLILDGMADEPVVISDCKLMANNSKGGAIYCEQGGKVIVKGATFADNLAKKGADIYAEQKTDVTVAEGVVVNAAYGESVDINALNLVLTGEIGLTFHTVVPEKYLGGSFVLTSRQGDTVTYKISECGKDSEGRYLAKYNLSAIELSEPVTLTVCDKNGDVITSKTKSVEDYGKALLDDESITEKEKGVVRALLNYGHFAQIECSELNGWVIGKDYVETAKYGNLTTDNSVFDNYEIKYSELDPKLSDIGVQLCLGSKTDMNLYFPVDEELSVVVNDEEVEVKSYEHNEYRYRIKIKEISALDLAQTFDIVINEKTTITLSSMSYCKLAVKQNEENTINTAKALYEFYQSTVKYNEKTTSSGEDANYSGVAGNASSKVLAINIQTIPFGNDSTLIGDTGQEKNKTGKCDYCNRILSNVNGSTSTGSILTFGSSWIIIVIGILALCGISAFVIVKKKTKSAVVNGTGAEDEE